MGTEIEKLRARGQEIAASNLKMRGIVALTLLVMAIGFFAFCFWLPTSLPAAVSGLCAGLAALAFVSFLGGAQAKLNIEIVEAIEELKKAQQ